jgi:hypothetical protein
LKLHLLKLHKKMSVPVKLDLFTTPPISRTILNTPSVQVFPTAPLTPTTQWIEFDIAPTKEFTDLSQTLVEMRLQITGAAGAATTMAPINYIAATMFDQVEVYLNGKLIDDKTNYYGYRAVLEAMTYDNRVHKNFLQMGLYQPDTPGQFDYVPIAEGANAGRYLANAGWTTRLQPFAAALANSVPLVAKIHSDMTNQERAIIPQVPIKFRFHLAPKEFVLMGPDNLAATTFLVSAMSLRMFYTIPDPMFALAIEASLLKSPARYPVKRMVIHNELLPRNTNAVHLNNLHSGPVPSLIIIFLVLDDSVRGTAMTNPFKMIVNNIEALSVFIGSEELRQSPFKFTDDATQAYIETLKAIQGSSFPQVDMGFELKDYRRSGMRFYAFNTAPDSSMNGVLYPPRDGNIRVKLTMNTGAAGIRMFTVFEFDSMVTIDRFRNVQVEQ